VHRWSAERGELLTMVSGIAYFYRRFGYEYATSLPRTMVPGWGSTPAMPEGMQVRAADRGDLDALIELEHDVHAVSDLVLTRSRRDWEGQLQLAPEQVVWVAVRGGEVRGSMRLWSSEGLYWLIEPAAADLDAARALLAAAVEKVPAGALAVSDRPGTPFAALLIDAAVPIERRTAHYMRVPDPVALLDRIRPLLSRRLAASPFATERGRLMVTLYGTGLAIAYEGGEVTAVEPAPGVEEPGQETVGLPPDVVATLVLGRYGARELARRHDDMWLGHNAALMEVLFPRLRTDLIF
jgi:hypothetical protein